MTNSLRTSFSPRNAPKGSVLVFVVVLISILAMLAATSFFVVRQGVQVSKNAEQSIETKLAADTALRRATKVLHEAVVTSSIYTPEGAFAPGTGDIHPWLKKTDPFDTASAMTAPYSSPLRLFADEIAPREDESIPLSLLDAELVNFKISFPTRISPEQRFTSSPILGEVRDQYDFALCNRIVGETSTFYKDKDANFLKTQFQAKMLPRMSAIRGQYFIWAKDLDAKLYARNKEWVKDTTTLLWSRDYEGWGLDTYRTVDPDEIPITGANPEEISANWEELIRGSVLKYDFEGQTFFSDDAMADGLRDLYVQKLTNFDARFPHVHSTKELATQLDALYDSTDPDVLKIADSDFYSQYRAELDHYFTVYQDTPNFNSTLRQKTVKQHPAALNINTASVEVIAAALSQIPAEDLSDSTVMNLTLSTRTNPSIAESVANALAKRIVAKRPFLCRMDFEDFLAAHQRGAYDNSISDIDVTYEPQNDDLTLPAEADFATLTGTMPIVRMMYYAMLRRIGPGYVPAVVGLNAYAAEDEAEYKVSPELSLSQYLEMPGVPNNATQFRATLPGFADTFPNYPVYQRARFEFFFNNTQGNTFGAPSIPERKTALITPREFNNIINSINGVVVSDDIQNQPVGVATGLPVVTAGPNGTIETAPQGDDNFIKRIHPGTDGVLNSVPIQGDDLIDAGTVAPGPNGVLDTVAVGDDEVKTDYSAIWAGPNGIAETWIATHRPSYYSYINDVKFAEKFWDEVDTALNTIPVGAGRAADHMRHPALAALNVNVPTNGTTTIHDADRLASKIMRFYYRLPLSPGTATVPVSVENAGVTMAHLVTWRCIPRGMPSVDPADPLFNPEFDSETRHSFYQMTFDNWAQFSPYTFYLNGPLQCSGDPDKYSAGIDDTDPVQSYYSNAKPWSGRTPGGPIDADQTGAIDDPSEQGLGNGDVSWSPKFAFRSRFFSIFVLAQGMGGPGQHINPTTQVEIDNKFDEELVGLKPQGERRIEAVYDALLDQIIWQRSPVTDKRSMGEPLPPTP